MFAPGQDGVHRMRVAAMTTPRPKLRWYQFSLRSLLVFVLLFGLGLGWFGAKMRQARRQAAAVEAITRTDGLAYYDFNAEPHGIWWFRMHAVLGDDFFNSVVQAYLSHETTDADLENLEDLPALRDLDCRGTKITGAGLRHLRGLSKLETLDLSFSELTDAGLENLRDLPRLRKLGLNRTKITDTGSRHLKHLAELKELDLSETRITGISMNDLSGLRHLTSMCLNDTKVSDGGLEQIAGLRQLEELSLERTEITDRGLEHLKKLTNLKVLDLYFNYPGVTDAGIESLRRALPKCEIEY
jgi:hypothetical protein